MSKKNTNKKLQNKYKHKETYKETMCKIYAAYKRFHNGDVDYSKYDFINYDFNKKRELDKSSYIITNENGTINYAASMQYITNKIKDFEKTMKLQDAIGDGLEQMRKELSSK